MATFKALIERANLRAVRPTVIYVAKEMEEKALQKRERDMFGSDDVAIATRFFHTFKMEAKEVPDQELREKYAKTGPTMIFLDHQGNVVSEATGNFDKSVMLKNLDKAYSTVYAGKLGSQIEKFKEFITRYERAEDNVANQSKRTTEAEGKLVKDSSDRAQKAYAEEKAKLAELQKEITKLEEERVKLLSPALKDADKAVAQSGN